MVATPVGGRRRQPLPTQPHCLMPSAVGLRHAQAWHEQVPLDRLAAADAPAGLPALLRSPRSTLRAHQRVASVAPSYDQALVSELATADVSTNHGTQRTAQPRRYHADCMRYAQGIADRHPVNGPPQIGRSIGANSREGGCGASQS